MLRYSIWPQEKITEKILIRRHFGHSPGKSQENQKNRTYNNKIENLSGKHVDYRLVCDNSPDLGFLQSGLGNTRNTGRLLDNGSTLNKYENRGEV